MGRVRLFLGSPDPNRGHKGTAKTLLYITSRVSANEIPPHAPMSGRGNSIIGAMAVEAEVQVVLRDKKPDSTTQTVQARPSLPVGGRLGAFWQTWQKLGADPYIVRLLREGYTIPFREIPQLSRIPLVNSRYQDPHKNSLLQQAVDEMLSKAAQTGFEGRTNRMKFKEAFQQFVNDVHSFLILK